MDEHKQVGLRDPAQLRDLWQRAGLKEVSGRRAGDLGDYADFDDLWFSFEQGVGRSGAVYLRLDPVRREALRSRAHKLQGAPRGRFRLAEVG